MSTASPEKQSTYSHSPTPALSDVELEAAVLRSVVATRPVGQHRHILMIQLQAQVHQRTGVWLMISDLWDRIGGMFDLDQLDSMSSSTSLPSSPQQLSPVPRPRNTRKRSSASLSPPPTGSNPPSPTLSSGPSGPSGPSKSAQCINSDHFRSVFNLPYLRLGEEEWKPNLYTPESLEPTPSTNDHDAKDKEKSAAKARRRSRSVASSTAPAESEGGQMGEIDPDLSEGEAKQWKEMIYQRAIPIKTEPIDGEDAGDSNGVEHDDDDWEEKAMKQLAKVDRLRLEKEEEERKSKTATVAGGTGKKRGRPSKAKPVEREATSELSEDEDEDEEQDQEAEADDDEEEEEEEEQDEEEQEEAEEEAEEEKEENPAPRAGRGTRATAGKRKRDSVAKEESVEKDIKETKARRKKR